MKAFLHLIRLPNLLIVAFTQYAMRYLILEPMLPSEGFSLQFTNVQFFLLVLSTIFITAAGYIINDYFDARADRINKPEKVVVGVAINRRQAMTLHTVFNIIGVLIGVWLSMQIELLSLGLIFVLTSGLLWFYSTNYKRQFLIGNLLVSLFTAMVPMIVVLFELPLLNREYGAVMLQHNSNFNYIFAWVAGFSVFAFLTTFLREIVKDAEDFEGDAAYGLKTLPIVLGSKWTKVVILGVLLLTVALLGFVLYRFIMFSGSETDFISLIYFLVFLFVPFSIFGYIIIVANSKKDYHRSSNLLKLIMLFGILYAAVVYYLINYWI